MNKCHKTSSFHSAVHDYGFVKKNNRPVAVNLGGKSNDVGLNAIQTWCLLRNVPLLFGDLVTSTDKHWGLLLSLLQLTFSPMLSHGIRVYLKHLIVEHHKLFKMYPQNFFFFTKAPFSCPLSPLYPENKACTSQLVHAL